MDTILMVGFNGTGSEAKRYLEKCYKSEGLKGEYKLIESDEERQALRDLDGMECPERVCAFIHADTEEAVYRIARELKSRTRVTVFSAIPFTRPPSSSDRMIVDGGYGLLEENFRSWIRKYELRSAPKTEVIDAPRKPEEPKPASPPNLPPLPETGRAPLNLDGSYQPDGLAADRVDFELG